MIDIKNDKVTMEFGAGGRATEELIREIFKPAFANSFLDAGNDQAILPIPQDGSKLAFTTDSFVVTPLFFPGGNIGDLAVNGTINDLSVGGAIPKYLSAGFIIEEGMAFADLQKIADTMGKATNKAGIKIVTGDTKVVEKGSANGLFINTAGVGFVPSGTDLSVNKISEGDIIILSGPIAEHGVAIMSSRKGMEFETSIKSDSAPLHTLCQSMIKIGGIKCMRDATRGGVAAVLNELATQASVGMLIDETAIPIKDEIITVCSMFGYDPLNIACEGRLIAIVQEQYAKQILAKMWQNPLGKEATIIGEVISDPNHLVQMRTKIGGSRLVEWFYGEQLPRIC